MKNKIIIGLFLSMIIIISLYSTTDTKENTDNTTIDIMKYTTVDKNRWLDLLYIGEYDQLDRELNFLQEAYERDYTQESELFDTISSFYNSDPLLEEQIDNWIKAREESVFAHLIKGVYYTNLGLISRGYAFSNKTSSEQFSNMNRYFQKAEKELSLVIAKNPKQIVAYVMIIHTYSFSSQRVKKENIFADALKYNPLSFYLSLTYLSYLERKWGGSLDEIREFMEKVALNYDKNSRLKRQEGFLDYVKAKNMGNNECQEALEYINKAITLYPRERYFKERARRYICLNNYQKALEDYNLILKSMPQHSPFLLASSQLYYYLKEYDLALQDIDEAIQYDKMEPYALSLRGKILYSLNKKDKSLIDFKNLLVYKPNDTTAHEYIGYIYYSKKQYSKAYKSLKLSTDLGNQSSYIWYYITTSQWYLKDCDFIKSAYIYKRKCEENSDCKAKNIAWVMKSIKYAKSKKICK
ncbi:MAG: DUF4034 domain-containing protein [Sulfurovum sp.]